MADDKPLNQTQVITALAEGADLPKAQVKELLGQMASLAANETKKRGSFVLPGFGKLVLAKRAARDGRNPATGETIRIPAKTTVKFRVAKGMKDQVAPPKKK